MIYLFGQSKTRDGERKILGGDCWCDNILDMSDRPEGTPWLGRIIGGLLDKVSEVDNRKSREFLSSLPDDLTIKDVYWQDNWKKMEVREIPGWTEFKRKLGNEKEWTSISRLLVNALRSSSDTVGLGDPGWTLGKFRSMTETDFPEKPEREGRLSRAEFVKLHPMFTTPKVEGK